MAMMMHAAVVVGDVDLDSFPSFLVAEQLVFDAFAAVPEVTTVVFAVFYVLIMHFWHWQVSPS